MVLPVVRTERHDYEWHDEIVPEISGDVLDGLMFYGVDRASGEDRTVEVEVEFMSDGSMKLKNIKVLPSGL